MRGVIDKIGMFCHSDWLNPKMRERRERSCCFPDCMRPATLKRENRNKKVDVAIIFSKTIFELQNMAAEWCIIKVTLPLVLTKYLHRRTRLNDNQSIIRLTSNLTYLESLQNIYIDKQDLIIIMILLIQNFCSFCIHDGSTIGSV